MPEGAIFKKVDGKLDDNSKQLYYFFLYILIFIYQIEYIYIIESVIHFNLYKIFQIKGI